MEELGFDTLALKPVAEHHVTPVPSPVPYEMADEPFRFINEDDDDDDDDDDNDDTRGSPRVGLVASLLLRLLDDVKNKRLDKSEILHLTECVDALNPRAGCYGGKAAAQSDVKETNLDSGDNDHDSESVTSSRVINELVEFTLGKILADVKSGSLDEDDLTSLTVSIISDTNNNSGLDDPKTEPDPDIDDREFEKCPESTEQVRQIEDRRKQNPKVVPDDSAVRPLHRIPSECCSSTTIPQIGAEVIAQTIINIKEGKLSSDNMEILAHDVSKDHSVKAKASDSTVDSASSLECFLVDVLEDVKTDIGKGVVSSRSMENVTQQLALLSVQDNDSFRDGSILSLTEITYLIKCALFDVARDMNVEDKDTRFHPISVESDEKSCGCISSSSESSGVVKFASDSVVSDLNAGDSDIRQGHADSGVKNEAQSSAALPSVKKGVGTVAWDTETPEPPSSVDTFSVISDSPRRKSDPAQTSKTGSIETSGLKKCSQKIESADSGTRSRVSSSIVKHEDSVQGHGQTSEATNESYPDRSQARAGFGSPQVTVTISSPQDE